jgi:hypothetical protein
MASHSPARTESSAQDRRRDSAILPQNFEDKGSATGRRHQGSALARGKLCLVAAHEENILSPVGGPGPAPEDTNPSPGWRHAIDLAPVKYEAKENAG